MNLTYKIETLRVYEGFCYSVCLALLAEEEPAAGAAQHTLLELYSDQSFWSGDEQARQSLAYRTAARLCIVLRQHECRQKLA
ncbi:hypothetical protein ACFO9Q_00355 [Paenibacillus sp. GCM10023252]|uniref:hypothetical protein n=1 Tax=Paenibacillus sp. GCM10023252 TaxID=3252649 RepID=UPI00361E19F6